MHRVHEHRKRKKVVCKRVAPIFRLGSKVGTSLTITTLNKAYSAGESEMPKKSELYVQKPNRWLRAITAKTLLAGAASMSLALAGCGGNDTEQKVSADEPQHAAKGRSALDPYPSTYQPYASELTLIKGATVLTATGEQIEQGSVLMRDGKIEAVGTDIKAPKGAKIINGEGKWVTPGIIDLHSHLGFILHHQHNQRRTVMRQQTPILPRSGLSIRFGHMIQGLPGH